MDTLDIQLKVPDLWQQQAVRHLQAGADVVVHAPTGAGKTYIFELLIQQGWKGKAVYTVPTRALANDKRREWQALGWPVGIVTGDVTEQPDAPVVVATLETQKRRLMQGEGPALLVIDEYQMLADPVRGMNYELALAVAPPQTQLLLLSGSVANPDRVVAWLRRLGRRVEEVSHHERPVPLDEVPVEALLNEQPKGVSGYWPRIVAAALRENLGPILLFAPRRKAAEELAFQLAAALPLYDGPPLASGQTRGADPGLLKLLRSRIAYHHSGLSYQQRAGLVEPLAKSGALRVVVATTGLAAGINFSMRSVLVTDREYQAGNAIRQLRPDELLQMFGRAGRRGLDERGFILVAPGKPRLSEARPLALQRVNALDWPAILGVMAQADAEGKTARIAADALVARLFCDQAPALGFERLRPANSSSRQAAAPTAVPKITEMLNSRGEWERRRPAVKVTLAGALIRRKQQWVPALSDPRVLQNVTVGTLCHLPGDQGRRYGRRLALATFPREEGRATVTLVKPIHRALCHLVKEADTANPSSPAVPRTWSLEKLEKELILLPRLTQGGQVVDWFESGGVIYTRLDYSHAQVLARTDGFGQPLINPPMREIDPPPMVSFAEMAGLADKHPDPTGSHLPAPVWQALGLIDATGRPTRRGILVSFFNHGEGLAIAAALEDEHYPMEDLVADLANLRASHRFNDCTTQVSRLGTLCRITYQGRTCTGYLEGGLPPEFGDGAAEVLATIKHRPGAVAQWLSETLRPGDIERARLEWQSLLNHIAHAPDYAWPRWQQLRQAASRQAEVLDQLRER
jgi:superfamily II DNA/RNA helicase